MLNSADLRSSSLSSQPRARLNARLEPSPLRLCAMCGAPMLGRVHGEGEAICHSCLAGRERMIRSVYYRMQAQNKIAALDPFLDEYEEEAHDYYEEEESFCL